MRIAGTILLCSSLALFGTGCSADTKTPDEAPVTHQVDVSECYFPLPRAYADSELSVIVSFAVNDHYRAEDLKVFTNLPEIPESAFQACLANWTVPFLPVGTQVFVAFRWEGAGSWKYARLSAEAVDYLEEVPMSGFGGEEDAKRTEPIQTDPA